MKDIFIKQRLNREKKRMQDLVHCLGISVYTDYKKKRKSDKETLLKNIEECESNIIRFESVLKEQRIAFKGFKDKYLSAELAEDEYEDEE